jgi:hypothetical protein
MYKEVFQAGDRTEFLEKSRLEFWKEYIHYIYLHIYNDCPEISWG